MLLKEKKCINEDCDKSGNVEFLKVIYISKRKFAYYTCQKCGHCWAEIVRSPNYKFNGIEARENHKL